MTLHQLLQCIWVGGTAQDAHHYKGPGAGPHPHGLPKHGWIVEVVEKVVAPYHSIGRSKSVR